MGYTDMDTEQDERARLVALSGVAGSGKSTAAAYLQDQGFELVKFAGPLKAMMRAHLMATGVDVETVEQMVEGDLKEKPCVQLCGHTPRYAMQTLGTEWGRDIMFPEFWVNAWECVVSDLLRRGISVVCDDCRFSNEAEVVHKLGGVIIGLEGHGGIAGTHPSEVMDLTPDVMIQNTGTIADLHREIAGTAGLGEDDDADPDVEAMLCEEFAARILSCGSVEEGADIIKALIRPATPLDAYVVTREEVVKAFRIWWAEYEANPDEFAEGIGNATVAEDCADLFLGFIQADEQ